MAEFCEGEVDDGWGCVLTVGHVGPCLSGEDREDMDLALEYIRSQIQGECISYGEIAWLVDHAAWIHPDDTELLQWAEVPEEDRYRAGQGTGKYLDNPSERV